MGAILLIVILGRPISYIRFGTCKVRRLNQLANQTERLEVIVIKMMHVDLVNVKAKICKAS